MSEGIDTAAIRHRQGRGWLRGSDVIALCDEVDRLRAEVMYLNDQLPVARPASPSPSKQP